ncbi:unnamed protein product [Ectocarpus sp. CCAP 1310/34]|nr:unnamed protein product [Ectocarpus sp. CCAP 1310/34]
MHCEHPHANDPIITPVACDSEGATAGVVCCASTSADTDEADTTIWEGSWAHAPIPPSASPGVGRASTSSAECGKGVPMPKFTAYPGPGRWSPAQPSRAAQLAEKASAKAAKSNVMVPVNVPASVPPIVPFLGAGGSAKNSSATSGHSGMSSISRGMGIGTSTSRTGKNETEQVDSTQTGQALRSPPLPWRAPRVVDSGACMMAGSSGAADRGEDILALDPDLHLMTGAGSVESVGAETPTTSVGPTPPAISGKTTGASSASSSQERRMSVPDEGVAMPLAPGEDAAAVEVPVPPATDKHQSASHNEKAASGGASGGIELCVSVATATAAADSAAQSQPAGNTPPADMPRQGGASAASAPSESSSLARGSRGGGSGGTGLRGVGVINSGVAAMGATVAWLGRSGVRMMWSRPERGAAAAAGSSATGSSAATESPQGTRASGTKRKATQGSWDGKGEGFAIHTGTKPESSATTGASPGSPAAGMRRKVTPTSGDGEERFVPHTRTKFGSSATIGASPATSASGTKRKAAPGSGDVNQGYVPHTRTTLGSSATTGAPAGTSASGSKRKVQPAFGDGEARLVPRTHVKRKMTPTFGDGVERFAPRTKVSVKKQVPAKLESVRLTRSSARAVWVDSSSSNTIKRGRDTDDQATAEGRNTGCKRTKHNKSMGNKSVTDSPSATTCRPGRSRKRMNGDDDDNDDGGGSAGGGSSGAWSASESRASKRIRLTPSGKAPVYSRG